MTKTPQNADDNSILLEQITSLQRRGEFFRQADLAQQAVQQYPEQGKFRYYHVLALANSGASAYAQQLFEKYDLNAADDLLTKSLKARLLKDQAFASTGSKHDRAALLVKAATAYEEAAKCTDAENIYYPQDNAAQLYLLAGETEKAQFHAQLVLDHIDQLHPDEEDSKWRIASCMNSYIILGKVDAAMAQAEQLKSGFTSDWAGAATTIEHLERLVTARGFDITWIDSLRPPAIAFYAGHIISAAGGSGRFPPTEEKTVTAKIVSILAKTRFAHAYGALAAGADIIFAETFLNRGANLTIVLPCAEDDFLAASVAPSGDEWLQRYWDIRNNDNVEIQFATTEPLMDDETMFAYGSRLAMGLAVLRANQLKTFAHQFALWDGTPARGRAGTAIDVALWASHTRNKKLRLQTIIPLIGDKAAIAPDSIHDVLGPKPANAENQRVARAALFGDFKGFSKLKDSQIPQFVSKVFGTASTVLKEYNESIMFQNSWGDGLYIVTKRAHDAAELALSLQEALSGMCMSDYGLPNSLQLRIGGHLGPVFERIDPIIQRPNFFGSQVSFAARIEPVVPPGGVYVSEQFAAALALEHTQSFKCDLVGTTELSKNYGASRIFLLQRHISQSTADR